ncbi:unnamed protein product [Boreogadus saida]
MAGLQPELQGKAWAQPGSRPAGPRDATGSYSRTRVWWPWAGIRKRVNGKPIVARATMHGTVPQPSRRPRPGTQPDQGPAPSQTRDRHPARPGTGTQPDQGPAPSQTRDRHPARPGPGTQPDQDPAPSQTRTRHPARPGPGTQPDQDRHPARPGPGTQPDQPAGDRMCRNSENTILDRSGCDLQLRSSIRRPSGHQPSRQLISRVGPSVPTQEYRQRMLFTFIDRYDRSAQNKIRN